MFYLTLVKAIVSSLCLLVFVTANVLPPSLKLGGALVAAVEDDIEQKELTTTAKMHLDEHSQKSSSTNLSDVKHLMEFQQLLNEVHEGRGKYHKRRKTLKYLYPLMMGIIISKTILIPLLLKMLTALSVSSFVMSKIALVIAGLLALKWIFEGAKIHGGVANGPYATAKERRHIEVVHIPAFEPYHHGGNSINDDTKVNGNWDSLTLNTHNTNKKYIPLMTPPMRGVYRHPQHNYDAYAVGKPFL